MARKSAKAYHLDSIVGAPDKVEISNVVIILDKDLFAKAREYNRANLKELAQTYNALNKAVGKEFISSLSRFMETTAQSTVPIDSEELRNSFIRSSTSGNPSSKRYKASVFVKKGDHFGSRRTKPEHSTALALFLDKTKLKRSQPNYFGGTTTDNWIETAQSKIEKGLDQVVDQIVDEVINKLY